MSLINDALKRANSAPPPLPANLAPPPVPVKPVLARKPQPVWPVVLLPLGLVMLFTMAGFFLWRDLRAKHYAAFPPSGNVVVAREPAQAPPAQATSQPERSASPAPASVDQKVTAPVKTPKANVPPEATANVGAVSSQPIEPAGRTLSSTRSAKTSNAGSPLLKLQGIIFSQSNPSAVINNKTLFVGETLGDVKVVAISRDSVTVESNGGTRILALH